MLGPRLPGMKFTKFTVSTENRGGIFRQSNEGEPEEKEPLGTAETAPAPEP